MKNISWKGYSYEELRYQRALTAIRCELEKDKLKASIDSIKQGGFPLLFGGNGNRLLPKILGALDIADYSLIAFKLCRRLYKLFGRKKQN